MRLNSIKKLLKSNKHNAIIMDITPAIAKAMLAHNTNNRSLSSSRVKYYSQEYKAGRWVARNGQPFIFDVDGVLVTGQHRLEMVIALGVTLKDALVVVGADKNAKLVNDTGKAKTPDDIIEIGGHKFQRGHKSAPPGGIIRQVLYGMTGGRGIISPYQMLEYAKQLHDGLVFAYKAFASNGRFSVAYAPVMAVAVRAYYSRPAKDRSRISKFFDNLCTGNLGDPGMVSLRDYIRDTSKKKNSDDVSRKYRMTAAHLHAYLDGNICASTSDKFTLEKFPIPWIDNGDGKYIFVPYESTGAKDMAAARRALETGGIRLSPREGRLATSARRLDHIIVGDPKNKVACSAVIESTKKNFRLKSDRHPYLLKVSGTLRDMNGVLPSYGKVMSGKELDAILKDN